MQDLKKWSCPQTFYAVEVPPDFRDVDPRKLHLPSSRFGGLDPFKLQRQIAKFGSSTAGMPPPWVYEDGQGNLVIFNGVTRATRVAKLAPGTLLRVEVVGRTSASISTLPTIVRFTSMIDPTRREILARLEHLSELATDMRFGQLVANLTLLAAGPWDKALWDMEDAQLLEAIRKMEADLSHRAIDVA
ncbi:MAG: hypothetical protein ACJ8C4_05145 [Gemmataceae bacterium]